MDDGKPAWDEGFAAKLRGALVLVGLTYEEQGGARQEQFFGIVESADEEGIYLKLGGSREGETFFLPPDPRAFFPADPGTYRLRATGEVLENPDYTTTWTISPNVD